MPLRRCPALPTEGLDGSEVKRELGLDGARARLDDGAVAGASCAVGSNEAMFGFEGWKRMGKMMGN